MSDLARVAPTRPSLPVFTSLCFGSSERPKILLPRNLRQTLIRRVGDTVNLVIPFQVHTHTPPHGFFIIITLFRSELFKSHFNPSSFCGRVSVQSKRNPGGAEEEAAVTVVVVLREVVDGSHQSGGGGVAMLTRGGRNTANSDRGMKNAAADTAEVVGDVRTDLLPSGTLGHAEHLSHLQYVLISNHVSEILTAKNECLLEKTRRLKGKEPCSTTHSSVVADAPNSNAGTLMCS